MNNAFKLSLITYPYHSSKHTGRGHDRYVAEIVDNTRRSQPEVTLDLVDAGFAKNQLDGLRRLPGQALRIVRSQADIYHAISPVGGAPAALLGRRPLVVTIHDLIPFHLSAFENPVKARLLRDSVKVCIKLADALIVPYQVTKDELVSSLGAREEQVHVVNYGVDHENYFPRPEVPLLPRTILYVGAVSRAKGVEVLIRAFAQVKARVPDARLVVAGKSSTDQPELEQLARELGATDVSFTGFVAEKELPERYASATVMVFPSHYGFGLSTLEAMACGTPVVGVRTLDAPEFFADAGLLAEPNDPASLADCLVKMVADPDVQAQQRRKSLARANEFSWERTARGNVGVYRHVLERRAAKR
ncbi:MAG TPA: glycosyltransferase family 1 protein [Polyangiaceae bacterium]|nr:glycosyltransferase family 1 protein [Polyangiaceae bacterium]